jgi:hypothetical protein
MSEISTTALGSVASLWRYPVKSMQGEQLPQTEIGRCGLLGDRAYALIDSSDGKVASAKNPRKWPTLFDFHATLVDAPQLDVEMSAVGITLPDGTTVVSGQDRIDEILSRVLQRQVTLQTTPPPAIQAEEYWPDMDGLDHRDTVTDFDLPAGTFFDSATVHVLTTATLHRLRDLYPAGRWDVGRFRPNVVVNLAEDRHDFVENGWVGRTVRLGATVRLQITGPCPRCVMTTLAQPDLPKDSEILRTAAQYNQANVGVYASVVQGGTVRRGDAVRLEENR